MKSKSILIATLLVMVATAVAVVSCKKDTQNATSNPKNQSAQAFDPSHITDMNAYLKDFKKKMQLETKGNETLSMENARWHLESVLNYTYGDAGHQTSDIQCDTFYYTLLAEHDGITLSQLNDAFNFLSLDVESAYHDCDLPDKSVLAIQTMFENGCEDHNILVKSVLSIRGLFEPNYMWFDSTDYWNEYYRKHDNGTEIGGGKCGPYVGECMNSGAPKELTKKANLHILPISCCEGYRTYVLNPVYAQIIPEDPEIMDYMMDLNSPSGYKLFVQHTDDGCIPPYEMNYYLGKSQEIIQHFKPIGKEPICCEYFWAEWLGTDIGNRVLDSFHGMWITYAEIHCEYVGFDQ